MKCLVTKVCAFLCLVPVVAFAGWQVATPTTAVPSDPKFEADRHYDKTFFPAPQKCRVYHRKTYRTVLAAHPVPAPTPVSPEGWHPARPVAAIPVGPVFQAGIPRDRSFVPAYSGSVFPNHVADFGRPAATYAISVSGSLKENVERIMHRYHWKVIWKAPYDYNFDGRVTGTSLPSVVEKLLNPFPLQATLYMSNRTMTVTPRKI
jgi:hypothetical protein